MKMSLTPGKGEWINDYKCHRGREGSKIGQKKVTNYLNGS